MASNSPITILQLAGSFACFRAALTAAIPDKTLDSKVLPDATAEARPRYEMPFNTLSTAKLRSTADFLAVSDFEFISCEAILLRISQNEMEHHDVNPIFKPRSRSFEYTALI